MVRHLLPDFVDFIQDGQVHFKNALPRPASSYYQWRPNNVWRLPVPIGILFVFDYRSTVGNDDVPIALGYFIRSGIDQIAPVFKQMNLLPCSFRSNSLVLSLLFIASSDSGLIGRVAPDFVEVLEGALRLEHGDVCIGFLHNPVNISAAFGARPPPAMKRVNAGSLDIA